MPTEIPTLAPTSETFVPTMTPVSVVQFVDDVEILSMQFANVFTTSGNTILTKSIIDPTESFVPTMVPTETPTTLPTFLPTISPTPEEGSEPTFLPTMSPVSSS